MENRECRERSADGAGADTDTSATVAGMAALADATTTMQRPSTSVECFPATLSVSDTNEETSAAAAAAAGAVLLHFPQSPSTLRSASQAVPRKRRRRRRRRGITQSLPVPSQAPAIPTGGVSASTVAEAAELAASVLDAATSRAGRL